MPDPIDSLPDVPALRVLEPPPGGLAMLRSRLADRPRRRWLLAVPALAAVALVLLVIARPRRVATPTPAPQPSLLRDPTVDGDVDFYWAASTPGKQRVESNAVAIDQLPTVITVDQ